MEIVHYGPYKLIFQYSRQKQRSNQLNKNHVDNKK